MKKKRIIKVGQVIEVKCREHGYHIGKVLHRTEDRVLINNPDGGFFDNDFVAPIYDIVRILAEPRLTEEEIKYKKSKFI